MYEDLRIPVTEEDGDCRGGVQIDRARMLWSRRRRKTGGSGHLLKINGNKIAGDQLQSNFELVLQNLSGHILQNC